MTLKSKSTAAFLALALTAASAPAAEVANAPAKAAPAAKTTACPNEEKPFTPADVFNRTISREELLSKLKSLTAQERDGFFDMLTYSQTPHFFNIIANMEISVTGKTDKEFTRQFLEAYFDQIFPNDAAYYEMGDFYAAEFLKVFNLNQNDSADNVSAEATFDIDQSLRLMEKNVDMIFFGRSKEGVQMFMNALENTTSQKRFEALSSDYLLWGVFNAKYEDEGTSKVSRANTLLGYVEAMSPEQQVRVLEKTMNAEAALLSATDGEEKIQQIKGTDAYREAYRKAEEENKKKPCEHDPHAVAPDFRNLWSVPSPV